MNIQTFTEGDHDPVAELLIGRRVEAVGVDTLILDDGTQLTFAGNEGGCSCGAGDYELMALNGCDNVITKVEFQDDPDGDAGGQGVYQIFVYAENKMITLARFEGSDGNGYYGTGYSITVRRPGAASTTTLTTP